MFDNLNSLEKIVQQM